MASTSFMHATHPSAQQTQVETGNACDRLFADPRFKLAFFIVEKVTLLALSILAACTAPRFFFPFFGAGVILGTAFYWNKRIACPSWLTIKGIVLGKPTENEPTHEHCKKSCHGTSCEDPSSTPAPSCSQGLMEQLTGVHPPQWVSLGVNVAIMIDHMLGHSHSNVYPAIIGLNAGLQVGAVLGDVLPRMIDHYWPARGDQAVEEGMELDDVQVVSFSESSDSEGQLSDILPTR